VTPNDTTCVCTNEKCGHPNGEPCGKPVEHADSATFFANGEQVGEEFALGICDACLDTAGIERRVT
jgi:hypothetical protein